MIKPQVTIVVSPRERFNSTAQSLESIYKHTQFPFELIYVDGGSPKNIKSYLEQAARKKGFELIRTDYYLSNNQARNIGLAKVNSKYVVFIDNDVVVAPGWLRKLVECAEETSATVVSPLICQGIPLHEIVHYAGGEATLVIENQGGNVRRQILEKIYEQGQLVAEVRDGLKRGETGLVELHCVFVRTSIFAKIGQLDEGMLNTKEHVDFYMTVVEAGGTVYLEPDSLVTFLGGVIEAALNERAIHKRKVHLESDSLVTYAPVPLLEFSSVAYYMLRWSDAWELASLQHLRTKWNLMEDEYFTKKYNNLGWRRHKTLIEPYINRFLLGKNISLWRRIVRKTLVIADKIVNKHITNNYNQNKPKQQPAQTVSQLREYAATTSSRS